MEQIGYSLIDTSTGEELQYWGSTPGQCVGSPEQIRLPNGDIIHCAPLGPLDIVHVTDAGPVVQHLALVRRMCDGERVIATSSTE
jgi:hypothetical protein